MKNFSIVVILVVVLAATLFAGNVPTMSIHNWTDLNGKSQVVARGKATAAADITIYGRTNGGGEWSKVGNGKSDADGKYAVVLSGGSLDNGYNVLKAVEGAIESAISRPVWVNGEKIYLSKPVDPKDAEIARLKKELAAAKAAAVNPVAVTPVVAGTPTSNLAAPAAHAVAAGSAKTFPIKVEADRSIEKFGLVIGGKWDGKKIVGGFWKEYNANDAPEFIPGDYGVNAKAANANIWSADQASILAGRPNFSMTANGSIVSVGGGYDNEVGGGNWAIRVNPDGSITTLTE